LLRERKTVPVQVDLGTGLSASEWKARFDDWRKSHGRSYVRNLLRTHLPTSLAAVLSSLAGNRDNTKAAQMTSDARRRLAQLLTALPFEVTGTEGFDRAMVTRGGVSLTEVDPKTLESRKGEGLFFAGEVLDLDGPCGGYNLQWAFSSGALAGRSAASFTGRR
jgi:predicted Rossmann fold flavoprotein